MISHNQYYVIRPGTTQTSLDLPNHPGHELPSSPSCGHGKRCPPATPLASAPPTSTATSRTPSTVDPTRSPRQHSRLLGPSAPAQRGISIWSVRRAALTHDRTQRSALGLTIPMISPRMRSPRMRGRHAFNWRWIAGWPADHSRLRRQRIPIRYASRPVPILTLRIANAEQNFA